MLNSQCLKIAMERVVTLWRLQTTTNPGGFFSFSLFLRAHFPAHHCLGPFQSVPAVKVDSLRQLPIALWIKAKPPHQCLILTFCTSASLAPGSLSPFLSVTLASQSHQLALTDRPLPRASEQAASLSLELSSHIFSPDNLYQPLGSLPQCRFLGQAFPDLWNQASLPWVPPPCRPYHSWEFTLIIID